MGKSDKMKFVVGDDELKEVFFTLDGAMEELQNASEQTSTPHKLRDFLDGMAYALVPHVPYEGRYDVGYAVGYVDALMTALRLDLDGLLELAVSTERPGLSELTGGMFADDGTFVGRSRPDIDDANPTES